MLFMDISIVILVVAGISFATGYSFGPPEGSCATRLPGHGVPAQTGPCPYLIQARHWIPGVPTDMFLYAMVLQRVDRIELKTFKGFMVSIQHPDGRLIGTLSGTLTNPFNASVGPVCAGSSLSHKTNMHKTFVVFQWTAPADLDPNALVIVRLTVVENYSTLYVDCNPIRIPIHPLYRASAPANTQ